MNPVPPSKPWSESCDQNRDPILGVLREVLKPGDRVLEVGSGTGQHAVYFGRELPAVSWQASDVAENLPGIRLWLDDAALDNTPAPLELDVLSATWPQAGFDVVFSANTAHIMSWPGVQAMFAGGARVLAPGGLFCLYGPFSYDGRHTSPSNVRFDQWLKQRDPASGVRDVSDLKAITTSLHLERDIEMPVNNRTLLWRRADR